MEMDMEMEDQGKTPVGMVRTTNGSAWRAKQAAAMTEQRKKMLLMAMKKKADDVSSAGGLGDIYTGPKERNPGVLKAQSDKAKADAFAASYKKK